MKSILIRFFYCFLLIPCTLAFAIDDDSNKVVSRGDYDDAALTSVTNGDHYLAELIRHSREQNLANNPTWLALGHYKTNFLGTTTSQVDDGNFFVSKNGKTNSQAELEATLASFFSTQINALTGLTPQCRFVARYAWLKRTLDFDATQLPEQKCERYEIIANELKAKAITVVFASAHPGGPASMFGHTLLRFDRDTSANTAENMLNFSLSYAAMIDPNEQALAYMFKGLFGGYAGSYAIMPYYMKLREYSQLENRDIWEYRLDLTPEQIEFVLQHTYEIAMSYYDYYFFTENCAYHVLSILDVAFATQPLSAEFDYSWTTPVDTLKALQSRKLIHGVTYQPSHGSVIKTKRKFLGTQEQQLLKQMFNDENAIENGPLNQLPVERQAATLDMLYDYVRYTKLDNSDKLTPDLTTRERRILKTRSQIKLPSLPVETPRPKYSPELGHDTARIAVGGGVAAGNSYQEFAWRPAYHDLLDPTPGYMRGYGLDFMDVRFRHYQQNNLWELSQFKVLEMNTLAPRDHLFRHLSWKISGGIEKLPLSTFDERWLGGVSGGGGFSYEFTSVLKPIVYGFVVGDLQVGDIFDNQFGITPKLESGLLLEPLQGWQWHLQANVGNSLPDMTATYLLAVTTSLRMTRNSSVRFGLDRKRLLDKTWNNAQVSFNLYF